MTPKWVPWFLLITGTIALAFGAAGFVAAYWVGIPFAVWEGMSPAVYRIATGAALLVFWYVIRPR